MMKKKTIKFTPQDGASYGELVASIRKELDDAWVKGVDFKREHLLNCFACECFEGMSEKGCRGVYRKDGMSAGLDVDFTVFDVKRRNYVLKKGGLRWRTTYRYICGLCGAEQTVCHVDEFSNTSTGINDQRAGHF